MGSETILVVDDDLDLRTSVLEILEGNGFAATGCASAEQALECLETMEPSLIIVDNMMPGMGGMALLSLIKKDCPMCKIIMITAFSTVENAVAALKAGADDYLAKPFRRDELLVAVQRSLEELRFERQVTNQDMDTTLASLANPIRRQILNALTGGKKMRFMDLTRYLEISDHTKVNFHLKNLKAGNLLVQDRDKAYALTSFGEKMVECLRLLATKINK